MKKVKNKNNTLVLSKLKILTKITKLMNEIEYYECIVAYSWRVRVNFETKCLYRRVKKLKAEV